MALLQWAKTAERSGPLARVPLPSSQVVAVLV